MKVGSRVCVPSGRQGAIVSLGGHCPIVLIQFDDGAMLWMPNRIVQPVAKNSTVALPSEKRSPKIKRTSDRSANLQIL
ncbi:MAG: hypothetical protein KME18_16895 [Phormidium tanganyikae FI6-MK23]|nr:hypothetical protein [Phormidium tanganyikae FI6-MK23]